MTKAILIIAAALALSACQPAKPTPPPTVVVTGCEHFHLISASRKDTAETREQILGHNTEYLKTCPAKGK